ncbi:MAG TPA: hypothetical protein PK228_18135 [Saprospiraceae bacterium]|nr:hypothetical protein [Saprospiraceae bacterium]
MATTSVTIRAVRPGQSSRGFAAVLTVTNRLTNAKEVEDIPESGASFDLEIDAKYNFSADPRDDNFGVGSRRNIKIRPLTRKVDVPVVPMGEECRIWLEDIKGMIAKGQHQKAKRQIRLAKRVYNNLGDLPKESADIIGNILKLEKDLP